MTVIQQTMMNDECIKKIPEDITAFVPLILPPWNGKCKTSEEYVKLVKSFYKLLRLKDVMVNGNNHQILNLKFIGAQVQSLAGIKQATPDLANVKPSVTGLHNLLETIMRGSREYRVSHLAATCVQSFTNQEMNDKLVEGFGSETDNMAEPEYLYILLVERFIPKCQNALMFIHKKARMGVELYYEVQHLTEDVEKLKSSYQLMLTSLENRAAVNSLLQHVMATKKKAMVDLKAYCSFWDGESYQGTLSIFEARLSVFGTLHFGEADAPGENLATWITEKTMYTHLVKASDVIPETFSVFKRITEDIDPIISGVRTFTPTPLELAQEKAVYMRNSVTRIRKDSEDFLNPESEKTIGKAKSLLEQIKSIRVAIDNLQLSGLVVSHETCGINQVELEDFYVKISNTLAQKEYEAKVNEAKQKAVNQELAKGAPQLELPPLRGFSSWLNFRKAINEIMPLHTSPLIKKQILLKGLKNKEDLSRCQSMDYEDGFNYLVQRYESSALIPGLIDELLKLVPASTDRQAYENLTQLISTTSMIQSYDQIDKMDSNCRSKLTYILLHREFQLDFLKDQSLFEEGLKKKLCPNTPMLDAISEASCMQSTEVEHMRRTWWLEQMTRYLGMARELVKNKDSVKNPIVGANKPKTEVQCFTARSEECPCCGSVHMEGNYHLLSLSKCEKFLEMSVKERKLIVDSSGYCRRCLWPKKTNKKCPLCSPMPHFLLQGDEDDSEEEDEQDKQDDSENEEASDQEQEQE